MGGGQDAQATVSSPPGVKIIRAGVKIPREILTPGGQAARGYLDPRGSSCPGVKINWYTGTLHKFFMLVEDNSKPEARGPQWLT